MCWPADVSQKRATTAPTASGASQLSGVAHHADPAGVRAFVVGSTSGPSSRRITPMAAFARRGGPEFNGLPRKASYCSSAGLESASRSTKRTVRGARSRDRAPPHSAASSAQSRLLLLRAVNQSLRFPVDTTRTVSKRGNPFWLHDPSGLRSSTPATLTSTVE